MKKLMLVALVLGSMNVMAARNFGATGLVGTSAVVAEQSIGSIGNVAIFSNRSYVVSFNGVNQSVLGSQLWQNRANVNPGASGFVANSAVAARAFGINVGIIGQ